MAQIGQPMKEYGWKSGWLPRQRQYKVTSSPLLWHSENNRLIRQAFTILQSGLVAALLVAGMDKFFHMLVDWTQYLAPVLSQALQVSDYSFVAVVGAFEVLIALGVAISPQFFCRIFFAWMILIMAHSLLSGAYLDIMVRDFGLTAAAYALWRLSQIKEEVAVISEEPDTVVKEFTTPELVN